MYKSLCYKEWLKIRQAYYVLALIGFGVILYLYFDIKQMNDFNSSNGLWGYIIGKGYLYYDLFRYVPLLAGLVLGFFQFVPELLNEKLKLTLHLPVKETNALLIMQMFVVTILTVTFLMWLLLLVVVSSIYFPWEIVASMIQTSFPWFLGGIYIYLAVSSILVEPLWFRRIILIGLNLLIISIYIENLRYSAFTNIFSHLIMIVIAGMTLILWSGKRFKIGVSKND